VYVDFGAQKSSQPQANDPSAGGSDNSLLGIIGAVLLLGGIGLAVYAWRVYGRRPKYMPPRPPSPQ
jgi:LPXTG-motif cell wall-anchored protein